MSQSPLQSFNPFVTHPFTNGSGLTPEAPYPSQYPMQFSAARQTQPQSYYPQQHYAYAASPQSSGTSTPSSSPSTPLYSPQPQRGSPSKGPIFVPFQRSEASSPELVLKRKVPYMTGK